MLSTVLKPLDWSQSRKKCFIWIFSSNYLPISETLGSKTLRHKLADNEDYSCWEKEENQVKVKRYIWKATSCNAALVPEVLIQVSDRYFNFLLRPHGSLNKREK